MSTYVNYFIEDILQTDFNNIKHKERKPEKKRPPNRKKKLNTEPLAFIKSLQDDENI